jgi:hypothetical protein
LIGSSKPGVSDSLRKSGRGDFVLVVSNIILDELELAFGERVRGVPAGVPMDQVEIIYASPECN